MASPTIPDPEILEAADNGCVVDLAMHRAEIAHDEPATDAVARERGLGRIDRLGEKIAEAELELATIGGFIGERSLGSAAVNSIAIKLGEAREQLPVLRQAVRDMEQGS